LRAQAAMPRQERVRRRRAAAAVLFATAGFREVVGRVAVAHVVSARSP
jgi:hypothetical protein